MPENLNLLLKGSALRFLALMLNVIIAFFMLPYLLSNLGDSLYGIWIIAGTIISYFKVLDIGLSSSTSRFLAKEIHSNDHKQLNTIFSTSYYLFFGIATLIFIATISAYFAIPLFVEDKVISAELSIAILIVGIATAFATPMYPHRGLLTARLRFDIIIYVDSIALLLKTAGFVYVIENGGGILYLALFTAIHNLGTAICIYFLSKRGALWVTTSRAFFSKKQVQVILIFGFFSFITFLADSLRFGVDNLVVSTYLGFELVSHYNIAAQLASYYILMVGSLIGVVAPFFTSLHGQKRNDELIKYFGLSTKLSIIISALICFCAIIFGNGFIKYWVGIEYTDAYLPMVILMSALLFDVMQIPSNSLFHAKGRNDLYAYITIFDAILNIGFSIFLVQIYGMLGVAMGTAIAISLSKIVIQPYVLCKLINMSLSKYLLMVGKNLLLIFCIGLFIYTTTLYFTHNSMFELMVNGIITLSLSLVLVAFVCFSKEDRLLFYRFLCRNKA